MAYPEITESTSLQTLLQLQPQGLYIDVYNITGAVQLKVDKEWAPLDSSDSNFVISDSTEFISGYNIQASIKQGLYFYIFPGSGKGNLTLQQHRAQLAETYSNSRSQYSDSYSKYYGAYAINGQTNNLSIQAGGSLYMDTDVRDSLIIRIARRET